jgi:hypothetical protein
MHCFSLYYTQRLLKNFIITLDAGFQRRNASVTRVFPCWEIPLPPEADPPPADAFPVAVRGGHGSIAPLESALQCLTFITLDDAIMFVEIRAGLFENVEN